MTAPLGVFLSLALLAGVSLLVLAIGMSVSPRFRQTIRRNRAKTAVSRRRLIGMGMVSFVTGMALGIAGLREYDVMAPLWAYILLFLGLLIPALVGVRWLTVWTDRHYPGFLHRIAVGPGGPLTQIVKGPKDLRARFFVWCVLMLSVFGGTYYWFTSTYGRGP